MKNIDIKTVCQELKALSRQEKQDVLEALHCWAYDELFPDEISDAAMKVAVQLMYVCSTSEALKIVEWGLKDEAGN